MVLTIAYFLYVFSSFFWVYLMSRVSRQLTNGKRKSIDFYLKHGLNCWRCKSEIITFDQYLRQFSNQHDHNYSLCTQCRRDGSLEELVGKSRFRLWRDRFDFFIIRKKNSDLIFISFIVLSLILNLSSVFRNVGQPIGSFIGIVGISFLHIGNWSRWYYLMLTTKKTNH